MTSASISVIVGFKDWGLERLIGSVRSLREALVNVQGEILVSDFGSTDAHGYRAAIESEGARYIRTETDGIWSRARALNAGLRHAVGDILVTTDADMVFTPSAFDAVVSSMSNDLNQFIVMQCHDLPEGIDHAAIENGSYTWDDLTNCSTLRPRWGMGGMIAVPRNAFAASRGLDERMEIYGGEDIDFARRMRRLGLRLHWLDEPGARMFHVWHPPSRAIADASARGRRAIALNRDIQLNDRTVVRNVVNWTFAPPGLEPLVTVVISTHNRSHFLKYAVLSVLAQTMTDFELIIVDDGSTDDTEEVVSSFADARVRYIRQDSQGIAVARNTATRQSRGKYIAVMDDDDIMLPTRLEESLYALKDGANGAYGGWIDFDDISGDRSYCPGKRFSYESLLFNNQVYLHPTLLIETRWLRAVPYDETLRSGSDYNLAVRLARSGARLAHTGQYLLMRRVHSGRITSSDSSYQIIAGAISGYWGRSGMSEQDIRTARKDRSQKDSVPVPERSMVDDQILQYLPDEFVTRHAAVRMVSQPPDRVSTNALLEKAITQRRLETVAGTEVLMEFVLSDISLEELLRVRADPSLELEVYASVVGDLPGERSSVAEYDDGHPHIDLLVEAGLDWLRQQGGELFQDNVMVLEGDADSVRMALDILDEPSEQFLCTDGSVSTSFGLVAAAGEGPQISVMDQWRRVRAIDVQVCLLSTAKVEL